ncbi:hypothetical protein F4703DRAFT_1577846 [Phycomyces blakesleeanus]
MNSTATNTDDVQQRPLQRHTMNRSSFYMLLFLLTLLFMNSSDDETGGGKRPTVDDVLKGLQNEKEGLANVTFGINVTHVRAIASPLNAHYTSTKFYFLLLFFFNFFLETTFCLNYLINLQPLSNLMQTKIDGLLDIGRQIPNSHFYHNITGIFRG